MQPQYCSAKCARIVGKVNRGKFDVPPQRRRAIYERDDWTCQLCGERVEDGLPPSDIWAATLDHIIPRSRGGGDGDENLQLAHRWCNSKKSDRTEFAAA
jgi:5-methylcytosine-specific restriction endonuclease McrA